ncbi:MAG TPA: acyl-CoA dehydrogenase family protein [Acidimicrobiales bacterium]|nr:acyl-CoA dehydrogenase family protein [Acidimicrobiales bacterium]
MDFSLSEDQLALADLATRIFADLATPQRARQAEAGDGVDWELWSALASAQLLGLPVPEEHGGAGLGMVETCLLLEQQGRRVAAVPLWPTLAVVAPALAELASPGLQARWLPPLCRGEVVLSAALSEPGANDVLDTQVRAVADGGSWRLEGDKPCVPYASCSAAVLVPARGPEGIGLFMLDPASPGVSRQDADTTGREPQSHLGLDGAQVPGEDVVCAPSPEGRGALARVVVHAWVALAALQVGVAEEALAMAAAYTSERRQFGRPLATNQAVAMRAADCYIDVEAMRATMWQAAWRISAGLDAFAEALVAKWWAAEAGQRVVHAVQHLHGGLGADVEYPVHRYFLWGKHIETALGGGSWQLARLGAHLTAGAGRPA